MSSGRDDREAPRGERTRPVVRRWRAAAALLVALAVAAAGVALADGGRRESSTPATKTAAAAAATTTLRTMPASPERRAARPRPPAAIKRQAVGTGARGAVVAYRGTLGAERPLLVFLHGWGVPISDYDAWIDHLVRLGNTVVAPRYQASPQSPPAGVRMAAASGLKRALRQLSVAPGSLVVAGHSAGAALAGDLAATAVVDPSLPRPVAVFAVYPGRAILGYPEGIPARPLSRLPRTTRITALAGASDAVVGEAPARALLMSATSLSSSRRRFVRVTDPQVSDHFGPTRASRAARRAFWTRLDRLSVLARGSRTEGRDIARAARQPPAR